MFSVARSVKAGSNPTLIDQRTINATLNANIRDERLLLPKNITSPRLLTIVATTHIRIVYIDISIS